MGKYVSYERKCSYCGTAFTAHDKRKAYCSKRCRDIALRIKKGIPCNPNTEPYHKICKVCGKSFNTFRDADVTCSHECAIIYHTKFRHSKNWNSRINTTETWVNQRHGEKFEYVSHAKGRIRLRCKCCENVVERASSTVRCKNIKCEHCEEEKRLYESRQKLICFFDSLIELKTPKRCVCCGEEFFSQYHTQKYCSAKCKRRDKSRKGKHRDRCRHYGVYYDPSVTRSKVIKRDNGVCQICGKVCNEDDARWGTLGPDFPTLDHIVPLAKGGTHTWDNVQCACAMCNSDKRDLLEYA